MVVCADCSLKVIQVGDRECVFSYRVPTESLSERFVSQPIIDHLWDTIVAFLCDTYILLVGCFSHSNSLTCVTVKED